MRDSSKRFSFSDTRQISALVKTYDWEVSYTQVSPGDLQVESWETRIGDCVMYRERFDCHVVVHGTSTSNGYDVMLLEAGKVRFFGRELSSIEVALFPPGSEVDAVTMSGLETLHVQLPRDRVLDSAKTLGVELIPSSHMRFCEPGADRLVRVRGALQRAIEILEEGNLATWDEIEADLLLTLVALLDRSLHRNRVGNGPIDTPTSHAYAVRQHIHTVDLNEVDISAVAEKLGVGRHHLNRCFKEHYGVSIQEYIHYRRLQAAHDLLSEPPAELTVTKAAYSSGFHHLGRFSSEYKALFGEAPSQTLRKAAQEV